MPGNFPRANWAHHHQHNPAAWANNPCERCCQGTPISNTVDSAKVGKNAIEGLL
jgi:hypothetical protein